MDFGRIWAEVNLDALNYNLDQVKKLAGDRKLMVAVKADAYGHGLTEVAAEIQDRVDAFGVAGVEEGINLRRAGITDPGILVLSPAPYEEIPDLFKYNLTPTVTEPEFARLVASEAQNRNLTMPIHVEVDTGMGRTGVGLNEAAGFIRTVADLPGLRLEGVFTHFPTADSDTKFTEIQLAGYRRLLAQLEQDGHDSILRHAANSAGLMNLPESQLDMIRPGLIVYGILPESYRSGRRTTNLDLVPVMSLRSRVVNLRDIPAGNSISYERNFFTERDSRIAIITAGYGDGYPYALTNKGEAIIHGLRVPIVGNVCMDLTMLDVTGLTDVAIGDPVTLMGTDSGSTITANDIAAWADTIPYDIICRVSPRVPRIYIKDGKVTGVRNRLNDNES
jgi:alanine racemase